MRQLSKRLISFLLATVLLISYFPTLEAEAVTTTTPAKVTVAQAAQRIEQLVDKFDGKFFTVNQKSCGNQPIHGCDNCDVTNVVKQNWCKNLVGMGTLYPSTFPNHYTPDGYMVLGESCCGFACFAQWYIFAQKNTDNLAKGTKIKGKRIYDVIKKAKPGDVIRSEPFGHSMVFVSCTEKNFTVLDCNYDRERYGNCIVRKHTMPYSSTETIAISRVSNYDISSQACTHTNINNLGVCTSCNAAMPNKEVTTMRGTFEPCQGVINVQKVPYTAGECLVSQCGIALEVTAKVVNAKGETWYKVKIPSSLGISATEGYINCLTEDKLADDVIQPRVIISEPGITNKATFRVTRDYTAGNISNGSTFPTLIKKGDSVWLEGTLESYNDTIRTITAGIYSTGGSVVGTNRNSVTKTCSSYAMKDIDRNIYFSSLSNGNYVYKVNVTLTKGKEVTIEHPFTVYESTAPATYSVTYNANGGTGAPAKQTKVKDVSLILSSTEPKRDGYVFEGWATSASGAATYVAGDTYTSNSASTLYAVWSRDTAGESISWDVDENGLLTISGAGEIQDFVAGSAPWYDEVSSITSIVVEEGITKVGNNAFTGLTEVVYAEIADTVTEIGTEAFSGCTSLIDVYLPNSITTISNGLFKDCESMIYVDIPISVSTIGNFAFSGCSSLVATGLTENITSIGARAYYGTSLSNDVYIPSSVNSIGDEAFAETTDLSMIQFVGDPPANLGENVFGSTTANVNFPVGEELWNLSERQKYGEGLNWLGAIDPDAGLCGDNVTWSLDENGVLTISAVPYEQQDEWSEWSSWSRTEVIATDDRRVETRTIAPVKKTQYNYSLYAQYSNGNGWSGPFKGTFSDIYCQYYIEKGWSDTRLKNYDYEYFNGKKYYFYGKAGNTWYNEKTRQVTVTEGYTEYRYSDRQELPPVLGDGVMYSYDDINRAPWFDYQNSIVSIVVENGVTSISPYAFMDLSEATSVSLPESINAIPESAFENCGLQIINIPDNVTTIGSKAFFNNFQLSSIDISDAVTSIGEAAFAWCGAMENITVDENNPNYLSEDGVLFNKTKTTLIAFPASREGEYTVPDGVTTIGNGAFSFSTINEIVLPEGITDIADNAFSYCVGLNYILLPDGVESIGDYAFADCYRLEDVILSSTVSSIGTGAFSGCSWLTNLYFDGDAPSFASDAFLDFETTAYYSEDNFTWTETTLQNYGGQIFWIPLNTPDLLADPVSKDASMESDIDVYPEGVWKEGENIFLLNCDKACVAILKRGERYIKLGAELQDDNPIFTADISEGDEIIVSVKGDSNSDGKLNIVDVAQIKAASLGKLSFNICKTMVTDLDANNKLNIVDAAQIKAASLGKHDLLW